MSDNNDLFSRHEHALEKEYETCPSCGHDLHIKHSKSGSFLGCSNYPTCDYTRPLVEQERMEQQVLPGSECPACGHELAVKQGRYGMFIGCTNFPACNHIEHQETDQEVDVACPSCNKGHLQAKNNRFGKTFYACDNYPSCKYVLNHEPVAGECEKCGYPCLLKRTLARGEALQCADKKCGHIQA
ncbi:DNA topoisomerase family protein [Thalassotalea agarivorans]|uniref:Putative DNA topoisomerase n=1 Tax=Thalassotalea agarivorans TaxID=349064 RepID=A0A1I0GFR1_THASX|nr:topoisomerase DNA-binding C4 zinc finger domain-containing protein [Thalassotalea agarivorans]SET69114.1 putative DNA topoisomerase [Thalassotalea agarivorans]